MIAAINAEIDNELIEESKIYNQIEKKEHNLYFRDKEEIDRILETRMYKFYNFLVEEVEMLDKKVEERREYLDKKYEDSFSGENIEEKKENTEENTIINTKQEKKELQIRFGKGLPHDQNGKVSNKNFKKLLRAIRKGTDKTYNQIFSGCPELNSSKHSIRRRFHNLQSCSNFHLYGEDISFSNLQFSSFSLNNLVTDLESLFFLEAQRDLPLDCITVPSSFFSLENLNSQYQIQLSKFIKNETITSPFQKKNYMDNFEDWLRVQKGYVISSFSFSDILRKEKEENKNIITGRDLALFVYEKENDSLEFFLQLAHKLFKKLEKQEETKDIKYKSNNPYIKLKNRDSNLDFGKYGIYSLLTQAAERALKYASYLKWNICLIPRPEELAFYLTKEKEKKNVRFLSQVYPEGSNVSPSYPCGKISVVAACCTILKAFFSGNGETNLDEELNLLIHNWSLGTLLSGTNYPTDVKDGIILGEQVGISILNSSLKTYTEDFKGFYFTSFNNEEVYVSL